MLLLNTAIILEWWLDTKYRELQSNNEQSRIPYRLIPSSRSTAWRLINNNNFKWNMQLYTSYRYIILYWRGVIKVKLNIQFFVLFLMCLQNTCLKVGQDGRVPTSCVICICRSAYGIVCESRPVCGHGTHTAKSITNMLQM